MRTSDGTTRSIWYRWGKIHDFERFTAEDANDLRKVIFASHFTQLGVIFLWTSGVMFQVGWQGNFGAWSKSPLQSSPLAHCIRDPHIGTSAVEIFGGASVTIPWTAGIYEWLYTLGLRTDADCIFAGMVASLLGLAGLLGGIAHGLGYIRMTSRWVFFTNLANNLEHNVIAFAGVASIAFSGHLIHVALPASRGFSVRWSELLTFLPSPHGLAPLLTGAWGMYAEQPDRANHVFGSLDSSVGTAILTFSGSRSLVSDSLWLADVAHHHLAVGILAMLVGHLVHTLPLDALRIGSLHAELALALAGLGTASSFTANHLDAMPAYAFLTHDLVAMAALYVHHQYIAGFFLCGAFAHGSIYLVRDLAVQGVYDRLFVQGSQGLALVAGWLVARRSLVLSLLSAISLFLGFHTLGLYVHNDVMQCLGSPEKQVAILPVFAQWLQLAHGGHLGSTLTAGDFLVHHAIALGLHVTTLVLLKAALFGRGSKLMPDKASFGYGFPCDGPGRGGTCDISAFDGLYLAVFWMLNTVGWITFYWHWKHLALFTDSSATWRDSSLYLMGWLRDYLWLNSAQLIRGYTPEGLSVYAVWAWMFLLGHLIWATGFMFLISWRGYWQELIESITWAHEATPIANRLQWRDKPVALSIVQARFVGLAHFAVGFILTYGPYVIAASEAASVPSQ